jgi:hypothetical protein
MRARAGDGSAAGQYWAHAEQARRGGWAQSRDAAGQYTRDVPGTDAGEFAELPRADAAGLKLGEVGPR